MKFLYNTNSTNGVLHIECYLHVNGKNIVFKTNKICPGRCTISKERITKYGQNLHLNKYITQFWYLICFLLLFACNKIYKNQMFIYRGHSFL